MTATIEAFARAGFEDRMRSRERACVLGAILAASIHLGFMRDPLTSVAEGLVAALLAAVVTRFGVETGDDRAQSPGRSGRRVLLVSLVSVVVAPVWVAMLDPTRGIAAAPWRSILVAAAVCGGLAAQIAWLWTRFELDAEDQGDRRAAEGAHGHAARAPHGEAPALRLTGLLLGAACGPLLLLGDGLARAFEQDWSVLHSGLAVLAFATASALLAGLLGQRLTRALARVPRPNDGVASQAEAAARQTLESAQLRALEAELGRVCALQPVLSLECDRTTVEQAQASELVDGAVPALRSGRAAQTELSARLVAARSSVTRLRGARDAIEGQADALGVRLDSSAQRLVEAERMGRRRTVAATNLLLASRETASGLKELARPMQALEPATESLTELSLDVVARVELGRARLAETVAGMEAIRTATQSAESVIRGLALRTREIGGILEVIDDVGDQTSLLALNAAIIAAQAGEHGRAFSVVAEEIRDLADRVLVGTKEVGGLIRAVQAESEQAIAAIEAGSASVLQGVERSVETGTAFDEISRVARDAGLRIGDVVETVRAQNQARERVESVAARIEAAARDLAETHGVRVGDDVDAERSALEGRVALEELRAAVREQTGELVRVEGELRLADDRGREVGLALESGLGACDALAHVIESGGERAQSLAAALARLDHHRHDLARQVEALRGAALAPTPASHRAEPALRAPGDPS